MRAPLPGGRLLTAAGHALAVHQALWRQLLTGPHASGTEARALVGEAPLRWSGTRLRGRVLPAQEPPR